MNISEEFRKVLFERIRISNETQDNWDYGIEKCWEKEIAILSADMDETINFLNNECTAEESVWMSEVFDDIADKTQSMDFIYALYAIASKFPVECREYNVLAFIRDAEKCVKE